MIKEQKKTNGITLIALVVTIVVLLILAGVSISMLTGEKGIIRQATKAKDENEIGEDIEKIKIAVQETYLEESGTQDRKAIEDALRKEFEGNVNVSNKKEDGSYDVSIGDKEFIITKSDVVYVEAGIRNKEIVLNNSNEEILFKNTITLDDVKYDYPQYTNFEIIGISNEEAGEYTISDSFQGKTGKLEVIGNIENLTFQYQLEKIMLGDETFFVKVKIDDDEIIQKLVIAQGEIVEYAETFLTYTDSLASTDDSDIGKWIDVEEDFWNDGKAKIISSDATCGSNSNAATAKIEFQGTKCELLFGQMQQEDGTILCITTDNQGNEVNRKTKRLDLESKGKGEISLVKDNVLESNNIYQTKIKIAYLSSMDYYKTGFSSLVIDGIRIWK